METYTWHIEREIRMNKRIVWASLLFSVLALIISVCLLMWNIHTIGLIDALNAPKKTIVDDCADWKEEVSKQQRIFTVNLREPITDSIAMEVIKLHNIEHPHIVLAQMKLESGNYTSKLALENNNYFGMKQPRKRDTTSIGEKNGYASYTNWVFSIFDYAIWQRMYAHNLSEKEYLDTLATYAEDKKYITKVKKLAKNLENRK